jgi:hypothetical protein
MKKIKIHTNILNILFVIVSLSLLQSCFDLSADPDTNSTPSNFRIQILSPTNNGSLMDGENEIIYSLVQPYSIKFIELYSNGVFVKNILPNNNGSAPQINLNLDSSYVGKKINLYLIYYDNDGTSHKSNVVNEILVTGDIRVPYKPYSVSLINFNNGSCNISWKDSSRYIEKYELWRRENFDGTYYLHQELSAKDFNTNDYNLDTTKIYFYKIRGIKESGPSEFSAEVNTAGIVTSGNLYPPTKLTAFVSGTSNVILNWQDNSENENYFVVERRTINGNFINIATLNKNTTAYKDSANGLVIGESYYYRIHSYSNSDSAVSNTVLIKITSDFLQPPANLTAVYNSSIGVIELRWENSDNNILYFDIEKKTDLNNFELLRRIEAGSNLYLDFNILINKIYTYRIRGYDLNRYSDYSNEITISTY